MYKYYDRVPLELREKVAEDFKKLKYLTNNKSRGGKIVYDEDSQNYLMVFRSTYHILPDEPQFGTVFVLIVGDERYIFRNYRGSVFVLGGGNLSDAAKLEISKIYNECLEKNPFYFERLNPKFYQ